jgi:hypothetical protein
MSRPIGYLLYPSGILPHMVRGIVLVAVVLGLSDNTLVDASGALCTGKQSTLQCLKRNFRDLYSSNHDRFFRILFAAEKAATKCDAPVKTIAFLEIAPLIQGSAEVGEYFSEVVEKLCTAKPRCFLDSLARVNDDTRTRIIDELRTPTFLDEAVIREAFLRYREDPRYKLIMGLYFRH